MLQDVFEVQKMEISSVPGEKKEWLLGFHLNQQLEGGAIFWDMEAGLEMGMGFRGRQFA